MGMEAREDLSFTRRSITPWSTIVIKMTLPGSPISWLVTGLACNRGNRAAMYPEVPSRSRYQLC